MHFRGNLSLLWTVFDEDDSGFFTFQEFAKDLAKSLYFFRDVCVKRFGDMHLTFKAFDNDGGGRVDLNIAYGVTVLLDILLARSSI